MLLSVFSQGDKGTSWYIIWKGSVNVVTHGKVSSASLPTPWVAPASPVQSLSGRTLNEPKTANLSGLLLPRGLSPAPCGSALTRVRGAAWWGCDRDLAAGAGDHPA